MEETIKTEQISPEKISQFMEGCDPEERIVHLEYKYQDDFINVYYRNKDDQKCVSRRDFYPFIWAKLDACLKLCKGDRKELKTLMNKYSIGVKPLSIKNIKGEEVEEMMDGYRYMFFAQKPIAYSEFLKFFKDCGFPVYSNDKDKKAKKDDKLFLAVTPQEQYLISTGKRFFKGYDDYNQLLRLIFDLETEGLDPKIHRIKLNGIRLNRDVTVNGKTYKDFNHILKVVGETKEERDKSELKVIDAMLRAIYTFKPDIITAHNGENFDWAFIIERCEQLGTTIEAMSSKYFNGETIFKNKKETILKLGGEMETFHQTVVPGIIVTDSLHAVRRAQALDSNMKEANLKYVTKYSKMAKPNRVYVPGDIIDKTLIDEEEHYAFNDENGDWYIYDPSHVDTKPIENKKNGKFTLVTRGTILDGYTLVSGKYIVERYLFDDLWECDKVEYRYNTPNFLICKMLPVPFQKCCTMGTAGQWKALLMAWSYENDLAIPSFSERRKFTGGLSRLLSVGFVDNVAKFDYNSLYPSITLTWGISGKSDLLNSMLFFLEYVLTQREKYKGLKKIASKNKEKIQEKIKTCNEKERDSLEKELAKYAYEESFNDKKQLPLKILGNSYFGSLSAPNVFPWGDISLGERITCTGRQSLRLMISYFKKLNYEPIVGDSFTEDTPVFIKYIKDGSIDIKPISELIEESQIQTDILGREYDCSRKPYLVLCRSGWVQPSYIYRHKTNKDIYEITDGEMCAEVTEDHSLFDSKMNKIKPSEISSSTKLEYYPQNISKLKDKEVRDEWIGDAAKKLADGEIDRVPQYILNGTKYNAQCFYEAFMEFQRDDIQYSKTCLAGLQFLRKNIKL